MQEKKKEEVSAPKELDLEDSFNMLVKLVRTNKLNYDEHMIVDTAVKKVFEALNELADIKEKTQKTRASLAKAGTTK